MGGGGALFSSLSLRLSLIYCLHSLRTAPETQEPLNLNELFILQKTKEREIMFCHMEKKK